VPVGTTHTRRCRHPGCDRGLPVADGFVDHGVSWFRGCSRTRCKPATRRPGTKLPPWQSVGSTTVPGWIVPDPGWLRTPMPCSEPNHLPIGELQLRSAQSLAPGTLWNWRCCGAAILSAGRSSDDLIGKAAPAAQQDAPGQPTWRSVRSSLRCGLRGGYIPAVSEMGLGTRFPPRAAGGWTGLIRTTASSRAGGSGETMTLVASV